MLMTNPNTEGYPATDLVGTREAASVLGVRPQNFLRDWASRPDFPAPIASLAATRVWSRREIEDYRDRVAGGTAWPPRRRLSTRPEVNRWLPVIKRRIVRRLQPERIVLFGSQARGSAGPDSDLDILVVVPEGTDRRAALIAARVALSDIPLPKDVFVTTPSEAKRFGGIVGTILQPALAEGTTIYARS
jgi:uncharacterized protein